ncbi:hypothetical protein [Roseivirga misakiensis]|uniref:Lipoprotein n=1 Tax=Roseivirga misakiensis TaxID=1563681 RepID=A0A1E5T6V5_9BACT|nr:hypothetical protein [Roseivirga misakiensis]OEK07112.1 hypothetical protein BFP71_05495 [Roseivirga misakiensis]
MKKTLTFITCLFFLQSCGNEKIDTASAKAEMDAREIRIVSDAEIQEEAMKMGDQISSDFSLSAIPEPISDTYVLNIRYGTDSIYVKDHYFFDDPRDLSGKALDIFEAYLYNSEAGLVSEANVQKIEDGKVLLYTKPMIANDTTAVGMWTIEIPRKNVVLNIKQ